MAKLTEMGCDWENGDAALTLLRNTPDRMHGKRFIAQDDATVFKYVCLEPLLHGFGFPGDKGSAGKTWYP